MEALDKASGQKDCSHFIWEMWLSFRREFCRLKMHVREQLGDDAGWLWSLGFHRLWSTAVLLARLLLLEIHIISMCAF